MSTVSPPDQTHVTSEDLYLRFSSTDINQFIRTVSSADLAGWKQVVCNEHEWGVDVIATVKKVVRLTGDKLIKFVFGVWGLRKSALVVDPSIDIELLKSLLNPVLQDWGAVIVIESSGANYIAYSTNGNVPNDVCISVLIAYAILHPFMSDAEWSPLIDSWIARNKYIQITK